MCDCIGSIVEGNYYRRYDGTFIHMDIGVINDSNNFNDIVYHYIDGRLKQYHVCKIDYWNEMIKLKDESYRPRFSGDFYKINSIEYCNNTKSIKRHDRFNYYTNSIDIMEHNYAEVDDIIEDADTGIRYIVYHEYKALNFPNIMSEDEWFSKVMKMDKDK